MVLLKWLKRKASVKKSRSKSLPFSEEQIRAKAYEIWRERMTPSGSQEDDWQQAIHRLQQERARRWRKPIRKLFSCLNQPLIWIEKCVIEPIAEWFDRAAIFKIVEKLSPILEAIGVLLIPIAVWWFSQSYQLEKDKQERATRQQEAIKTYLNQLTTTFLDGDIQKNPNLQKVTRASTLALLQDPNMTGDGKGQVITFLSEIGLITQKQEKTQKRDKKPAPPILSLSKADLIGADLRSADLRETNLSDADLSYADLSRADLSRANLSGANLSGANLINANLSGANLSDAYLSGANLSGANLINANLSGANLSGANLSDAYLGRADLSRANLSGANLSHANLSRVNLGGANLRGANLSGANFSNAYLIGAHLSGANLSGANFSNAYLSEANLSEANLSGADNLTPDQLKDAKLCRTILPPDIKLDPNRDCKELGLPEN
jgi:uncharacterized protein YjbI with pentapeptide repeats